MPYTTYAELMSKTPRRTMMKATSKRQTAKRLTQQPTQRRPPKRPARTRRLTSRASRPEPPMPPRDALMATGLYVGIIVAIVGLFAAIDHFGAAKTFGTIIFIGFIGFCAWVR